MKLCSKTLATLPEGIERPTYDRSTLTAGIIHIGLGNFHRAHQAWYLHRLMQQGLAQDWAIIGAGVRPQDEAQRKLLAGQDYLTTLIELDPLGRSAEVIGPMIDFIVVEEDNQTLISQMADPAIRIVSLTVTEGGYFIDPASKEFSSDHPEIQHDVVHPDRPRTAFGAIICALKVRRDAGRSGFTCLSCDNLQGNGTVFRQTIVSLARLSDPDLASWIEKNCSFPNSMVDCIVPATGAKELSLAREFGVDDAAPVVHENFRQWVIEDAFRAGRPAWEKVGVTFSHDVHTYEAMKLRILNGGHQIIANVGELMSMETISESITHSQIGPFFRKVVRDEIVPHVDAVPDMTPEAYLEQTYRRFSNPEIVDTVRRVAFDGSSRHTGFLLPTLREALENGRPMEGLALAEALWARMCEGTREDGSIIEPNDPNWNNLTNIAKAARSDPQLWLQQDSLYGALALDHRFNETFTRWLNLIWNKGADAALHAYLQN